MTERLLTAREVAELVRLSPESVLRRWRDGEIPGFPAKRGRVRTHEMPQNEERQLRTALGQVPRYRQLLEAEGRTVKAMIVTEVEPSDLSWAILCSNTRQASTRASSASTMS
jgi:hypothetical protein